jgi:hypothetical protein
VQLFTKEGYAKLEERKKTKKYDYERDEDDSDDEDPPLFEFHFRRSVKDKVKLVVLPVLYFAFMVIAIVFGFYAIDALVYSYHNKVRSIKYVTVEQYRTIGIAMFPQDFATYEGCSFIYSDDLLPRSGNGSVRHPENLTCEYTNVTFMSRLIKSNRTAMVFDGPTLVNLKQSLALNFTINTTVREFSGMEYLLLENWDKFKDGPPHAQAAYLSKTELTMPLYTIPAGFRTWIKMSLTVLSSAIDNDNISNFMVDPGFSSYNDWRNISDRTTDIIYALFEWKSSTYEYVTEILSTNIFNTLGALAGVFVTLAKAGEYCWQWIRRIRRERRKKRLKHSELAEQHRQRMQEYQQKKLERRLKKLQGASVIVEQQKCT